MKPFITLAASAPFLLLAGVGHAASFSFSDSKCSSFNINSNGVISCVATNSQPTTDTVQPPPTTDPVQPTPTTDPVQPPSPSACPTPPAGTVIVNIGGRDATAKKDFDGVFDNPGSTFDSRVSEGQSKALQFTNGKTRVGYLSSAAGNYGNGYKDWAVSLCPGDFSNSLGDMCALSRKTSINMGFSTNGSLGCTIPANQPVYLNVRGTRGVEAGWVIQNVQVPQ